MTKPKLYYFKMSPPSRGVLLTAKALNLELDLVPINTLAGEQHQPAITDINPQHTVPTLNDNGKGLWESHAIIPYLVAVYGKDDSLCPKDPYIRAKIDQRLHYDNTLFGQFGVLARSVFFQNATEYHPDAVAKVLESYNLLEAFLKDDLYLVGNTLTVADLSAVAVVATLHALVPIDPVKSPKLLAWIGRLSKLPYYEEINQKPTDQLKEMMLGKLASNKNV